MKKIKKFIIDTSDMPSAITARNFTIFGDVGAEFIVIALEDGTLKYYDFDSKLFELGHNDSNNNLRVTLSGNKFSDRIVFPSGGGNYVIKVIPLGDTTSSVITKNISKQATNATVTFQPGTINTNNYDAFPTTTSTGGVNETTNIDTDWDITNASTDAGGKLPYGLRFSDPPRHKIIDSSYWYFTTTEAVADNPAGDGEDSTTVTVASVADLGVGTELYYHKGTTVPTNKAGSAVGATTITAIDTENKIITFSQAVAFEDTETMTFRAYGSYIKDATGCDLSFTLYPTVSWTRVTSTVRANVSSSTTITLGDTHGISGGNIIKWSGVGVNNASANAVTSVTPDPGGGDGDGAMVVQLAQTLTAGTVLQFVDIYKALNIKARITINQYPSSNMTVYLDLDKIITVGTQS